MAQDLRPNKKPPYKPQKGEKKMRKAEKELA